MEEEVLGSLASPPAWRESEPACQSGRRSEADFYVSLAAQPFHPMPARLVHLVQIDTLRELVLRFLEGRQLRFVASDDLQHDEIFPEAEGFRDGAAVQSERDGIERRGKLSGFHASEK